MGRLEIGAEYHKRILARLGHCLNRTTVEQIVTVTALLLDFEHGCMGT